MSNNWLKRLSFVALLFILPAVASAHGPQIQVTASGGKIETREVVPDGPYSNRLTSPISAYVMPVLPYNGVWYTRPNIQADALDPELPAFYSGPGIAFGYDQAAGTGQVFPTGSKFLLQLTDSLKVWNGTSFEVEPTVAIEAFRGAVVAKTTTAAPYASLLFPTDPIEENYGVEGGDAHSTVRFRMLGDGSSSSVVGPDGIYLMTMRLESTATSLSPSDPYYFVMHKNASPQSLSAAVASLGLASGSVQYVPEPGMLGMLSLAAAMMGFAARRRRHVRV